MRRFVFKAGTMALAGAVALMLATPCEAQRKGYRKGNHTNNYADGSSYTGEWKDFLFHGQGTYHYADGSVYEGEWKEGKPDGEGTFTSPVGWEDLKKGPDGLVLVVVQDYRNDEVLMAAYMNREAYEETLRTGRMTYWSRSRQELWIKGETSGHFQYLKELRIDCDNDTLLARIEQIGAACHTGNRSCFYRVLSMSSEY